MRFLVGSILVLVSIIFVQSAPIVRQVGVYSPIVLQGLIGEFDEFLADVATILSPDQFESFKQELLELIEIESTGNMDPKEIELKTDILFEKYFGPDLESRSDFQHPAQNVVDRVVAALPSSIKGVFSKRQAPDLGLLD